MPNTNPQTMSIDACRQYMADKVFRLQPADYGSDYPNWPGMVGIEIEMLVASKTGSPPKLLPLYKGQPNLAALLEQTASERKNWTCEVFPRHDGETVSKLSSVVMDDDDRLTFEPGGQLEVSSVPYPCLSDAVERVTNVQKILDNMLEASGFHLVQTGINPWYEVDEIGLQMSKPRYQAMDRYFRSIGPYGQRMMRQTCTVQVNLDFGPDEATLVKRYLAAQLVAPFGMAAFANSPFLAGKPNGQKTFRGLVWHHTDPARTGFPKLGHINVNSSKAEIVESYLEKVLSAPVIFVAALGYENPDNKMTFRDWLQTPYKGVSPTLEDWVTHLSLHFPEVRARGFLELRSIDCQSRVWQFIPASFYTGILYNEATLDRVLDLLLPQKDNLENVWKKVASGLEDNDVRELTNKVFRLAADGYDLLPSCFRELCSSEWMSAYYNHFTARGRTPADDMLELSRDVSIQNPDFFSRLEESWQKVASCC